MLAHEISAYSLTAVTRAAPPLMKEREGSIVTLSYIGAERVVPNYNVMGIASARCRAASVLRSPTTSARAASDVNAISAGPIRTLSRRWNPGLASILDQIAEIHGCAGPSSTRSAARSAAVGPHSLGITAPRSTWTRLPHDGCAPNALGKTGARMRFSRRAEDPAGPLFSAATSMSATSQQPRRPCAASVSCA